MRKISFTVVLFISLLLFASVVYSQQKDGQLHKLIVFYSPTCHKCAEAKNSILPQIQNKFKNKIIIEYRDISEIVNYKLLLSLEEKCKAQIKKITPVFYIDGHFLNGEGQIKRKLEELITQCVNLPAKEEKNLPAINLITHFMSFKPFVIFSAGLIDGINPCAFTVIVFFISFLNLQGYRKRELIIIGLSFVFAVFLTYILIGIGIFGFLYRLESFWLAAKIFNYAIGILSITLGILALYDFYKFKKTKSSEGLLLQLPTAVKNQIHSVIGLHYRRAKEERQECVLPVFRLIFTALITGFLVSLLEAVCTGQTYLPTISFVLKTTPLKLQALSYLLLYNFMFIIPLLAVFILALWGFTSEQFAKILKTYLLTIKILMALLFFGLGIFLIWRA